MKYFISYGDDKFAAARERIEREAKESGFFDSVEVFSPKDLEESWKANFYPHLSIGLPDRGGGYWLWKPYFIWKTFQKMNHGDFLVYCDGGCTVNKFGGKRFDEYMRYLNESHVGIISFMMLPNIEFWWTRKDVFDYFGVSLNSEFAQAGQLMATILIIQKKESSEKLIKKWYDLSINESWLFTDFMKFEKGKHKEHYRSFPDKTMHSGFQDHRHDQSVFSLLRKIDGSYKQIHDETFINYDQWKKLSHIPFLSTRNHTGRSFEFDINEADFNYCCDKCTHPKH